MADSTNLFKGSAQLGPKLGSGAASASRFFVLPVAVLALCLLVGTVAVVSRARSSANAGRAHAQAEATARVLALELQFSRALQAAEVLGALARQSGGPIPNFQKTAGELHSVFPGLASLELQPGGIVSEIMPRDGNERAAGFNVLKDPAYGPSANAALQSRTSNVAAPLILYGGEPGLVARVPVFQRNRLGQNQFWGFTAASMRLPETLAQSGLFELPKRGYSYLLFVAGSAPGRVTTLSSSGLDTLQDAVQQRFRVQNLEFGLALRPRAGWFSWARILVESVFVVLGSFALFYLTTVVSGRHRFEQTLADANRQLAAETSERKKSEGEAAAARAGAEGELAKLRTALQQAKADFSETSKALHAANESQRASEAVLKESHLKAGELQARLDQTAQSASQDLAAARAELVDARTKLKAAEQRLRQLEGTAVAAQQAEQTAVSALHAQQTKAQATIADLQARLETQKAEARKSAELASARLKEAEATNQKLLEQCAAAEQVQARVEDSEERVQASHPLPVPTTESDAAPVPEAPAEGVNTEARETLPETSIETVVAPVEPQPEPASTLSSEPAGLPASSDDVTPSVPAKRKRARRQDQDQIELFAVDAEPAPAQPAAEPPEVKPERRPAPPPRLLDLAEFRRATNEIVPLLTDRDPGARDCFKANRQVFRSAFPAASFEEFEQLVKSSEFEPALEQLKKVAKRHGLHV